MGEAEVKFSVELPPHGAGLISLLTYSRFI
ncbi:hypothetical protein [Saccharobesus litoralis]